ncbi:signal peptidase II [bacterium]|nr:signal peptidase II [bacterium]
MSSSKLWCQFSLYRYELTFFVVAALLFALDQWTKFLVYSNMSYGQTIELPVSFVQLTYVRNFGGAFGCLEGAHLLFVCAVLVMIGVVYRFFPRICEYSGLRGCALFGSLVGGALGNLCDRVRLGYVVDMIDLKWWPVFNVADMCIVVALVFIVLMFYSYGAADETDEVPNTEPDEVPEG